MLSWLNTNLTKTSPPKPPQPTQQPHNPQLLPGDLAARILDLQFMSQTQAISKQLIANLCCLYIEAIEYYQQQNNHKYKLYLKRKEHFLKKTAVDQILKGKSGLLANKIQNAEQTIIQARNKSKSQVTKLLNQSQRRVQKQNNMVNRQLAQQDKRLAQRIHKRKTMSNRSIYSERDDDLNEEGISITRLMGDKLGIKGLDMMGEGKQKRVFI